jgi:hypothetical protein
MDFFKSILPHFKTLLPARKQTLKVEIMKLIDQACNEESELSSYTHSAARPLWIMTRPAMDDYRTAHVKRNYANVSAKFVKQ